MQHDSTDKITLALIAKCIDITALLALVTTVDLYKIPFLIC